MRSGQTPRNVVYTSFFYEHHYVVTYATTCVLTAWVVFGLCNSGSATPWEQMRSKYTAEELRNISPAQKKSLIKMEAGIQRVTGAALVAWAMFAELAMIKIPQSENRDAVGQWGPLIAFVLVVAGAGTKQWLDVKLGKGEPKDMELGMLH